jgi:hypothetical protein
MAAEYMKENVDSLKSAGVDTGPLEVYLAHLLGSYGTRKLLDAPKNATTASVLPAQANSNRELLGGGKTVGESLAKVQDKVKTAARVAGVTLPPGDITRVSAKNTSPMDGLVDIPAKPEDKPYVPPTAGLSPNGIDPHSSRHDAKLASGSVSAPIDSVSTIKANPLKEETRVAQPVISTPAKPVDTAKTDTLSEVTRIAVDTNSILRESLSVQKEMLANLIKIAANNNAPADKADSKTPENPPTPSKPEPLSRRRESIPSPEVSVSRTFI